MDEEWTQVLRMYTSFAAEPRLGATANDALYAYHTSISLELLRAPAKTYSLSLS